MKGSAIVYHKNPASALTQFVRFEYGSVVGLKKLPALSCLSEEYESQNSVDIDDMIAAVRDYFGLDEGSLCVDDEFSAAIEMPSMVCPVNLLRIKDIDPPFDKIESKGAKFIPLTAARGLPDFELLLLQKAYKAIMEG